MTERGSDCNQHFFWFFLLKFFNFRKRINFYRFFWICSVGKRAREIKIEFVKNGCLPDIFHHKNQHWLKLFIFKISLCQHGKTVTIGYKNGGRITKFFGQEFHCKL